MKLYQRAEIIAAIVMFAAFFLPWANIAGFMSFSGFEIPKAVQGIAQMAKAFGKPGDSMSWKIYSSYLLYLIPMLCIGICVATLNNQHDAAKTLSLYGGSLVFIAIVGYVFWQQIGSKTSESFKPFEILAIGYYLTVLSAVGLIAIGSGLVRFGPVEESENPETVGLVGKKFLKSARAKFVIGAVCAGVIGIIAYKSFTVSPEDAKAELEAMNIPYTGKGFFDVVKVGDQKSVQLFLKAGMHPDFHGEGNSTALHIASEYKQADIVDILLKAKASVDPKMNTSGATPLLVAANVGCARCAELLLAAGANANAALDESSRTPLIQGAMRGHTPVVNIMIKNGVKVNSVDGAGDNALVHAVNEGHVDTAKSLLDQGADANSKSGKGSSVLILAVKRGDADMFRTLLAKGANKDVPDSDGRSVMDVATEKSNLDILALLNSQGPHPASPAASAGVPQSSSGAPEVASTPSPQIVTAQLVEARAQLEDDKKSDTKAQVPATDSKAGSIDASFDCSKAASKIEKLICSSPETAAADKHLASAYLGARSKSSDESKLKAEQRDWMKLERNVCSDAACLLKVTDSRIQALSR